MLKIVTKFTNYITVGADKHKPIFSDTQILFEKNIFVFK